MQQTTHSILCPWFQIKFLHVKLSNSDLHYPQAFHVLRADEFTLRWTSLAPFGIQNLHA